jgi:integrase
MRPGQTVHGFRSSFADWAYERTSFSPHEIEMALAHTVGSAVERAYRRTDLFAKRVALMDACASFCAGEAEGTVVAGPWGTVSG